MTEIPSVLIDHAVRSAGLPPDDEKSRRMIEMAILSVRDQLVKVAVEEERKQWQGLVSRIGKIYSPPKSRPPLFLKGEQ